MKTISIAYRNIFRNKRRSIMTIIAISVSAIALLLFGGFVSSIMKNIETGIIMSTGHLHIYKKGYTDFGAGNTANYGIDNYQEIIKIIKNSNELKQYIKVTTNFLFFGGIAGNYKVGASNIFSGLGIEPKALKEMNAWNDYNVRLTKSGLNFQIDDNDVNNGLIGYGLAKMLRLTELLDERDVIKEEAEPDSTANSKSATTSSETFDFSGLLEVVGTDKPEETSKKYITKIDLLASTAEGGAPNVINLYLNKAAKFPQKVHNDNFIIANIELAQNLIYGHSEKKVTAIVLQLKKTNDLNKVKQIIIDKLKPTKFFENIEIKSFNEIRPEYNQTINMFVIIFSFVAIIMIMIIIVVLSNTMSMSVMERYNEIGTLRALGLRRIRILKQFVAEGLLLGLIGSIFGIIISIVIAYIVNTSEITWIPPSYANELLLSIHIFIIPWFLPVITIGIIAISGIASVIPAYKAAEMNIVDALRHN